MSADVDRRVREGEPVLELVARRVFRRIGGQVAYEDLVSLGKPALVEAARTWDPARAKFAPFAAKKVRWAIFDGVRRETHGRASASRAQALVASERYGAATITAADYEADEPLGDDAARTRLRVLLDGHAAALAIGLVVASGDMTDVVDPAATPEEQTARAEFAVEVRRAVAHLPPRERELVERHYYGDEPLDAIGRDLGISKSWASRLHAQAIDRLAEVFRSSLR